MKLRQKITFRPMIDGILREPVEAEVTEMPKHERFYVLACRGNHGGLIRECVCNPNRRGSGE